MSVDLEVLIIAWLRADTAILDAAPHVGTRAPTDVDTDPWVRLSMCDERQVAGSHALHLQAAYFQIDCYGSKIRTESASQGEASDVGLLVRQRMHDMPGVHTDAVVSYVHELTKQRQPDTEFTPARERYLVTGTVYFHQA